MVGELRSTMGILGFLAANPEVPLAIFSFFFFFGFLSHMRKGGSIIHLPLVGMLPSILLNLHHVHDWATTMLEEKGCTAWIRGPWLSGMEFVVSSDPCVAKYVTSSKFNNFIRGPRFREILEALGDGVISLDFEEWKVRRKLLVEIMHRPEFLHSLHRLTHQMSEGRLLPLLARAAREENLVDLQDILQRFSFDIMCSLILGVDIGSLSAAFPVVPFAMAVSDAEEAVLSRYAVPPCLWKFLKWLQVGPERKLANATKVIDEFIYQIITARKEQLRKDIVTTIQEDDKAAADAPFDLLTEFIRNSMVDTTGKLFGSPKSLRDSTFELLVAGWHTTSVAMAWLLWLVCTHPSTETKILDELTSIANNEVMPQQKKRGYIAFHAEELHSCVYLNAAIHESLRLFAPVPFIPKCAVQHDVLPTGEKLKPGTMVLLSLYSMGRMVKNWGEDATEFKPERWISRDGRLREESSYKFGVFGSGPRSCLGKHLALAVIKTVVASIVYNFRFTVAEGHDISVRPSVVLHMKDGLKGGLQERW